MIQRITNPLMKLNKENNKIELSQKERLLEIAAVAMGFLWLLGCFLKVVFF